MKIYKLYLAMCNILPSYFVFPVGFWEITESQGKCLTVMVSNVIYFEEYLMEKGAYYI